MLRYAKNVRLAFFCLSLALYGSLWLPLWLSLALTATLWHTLAHYCSLISRIQPLIGSQGPCWALIAYATMTHFLPLCITYIGSPTSEILVPQYVSSECLMSDLITEPPITSNFIVHLVANKIQIGHISFFLIFRPSSNFFEYFALCLKFLWIFWICLWNFFEYFALVCRVLSY